MPIQTCPVPYNQRPSNEYLSVKNSFQFSWIFQTSQNFVKSLMKPIMINYCIVYLVILNIYGQNTSLNTKIIGELFLLTSILSIIYFLQGYLACRYVYDRLMMSTITYEESGWYDGQIWVKSKEVLVQDRLIGIYELQPKITRMQTVLYSFIVILGISLFIYILN